MVLVRDPTKWLFHEAWEIFALVMYSTCQLALYQSPDTSRCSDIEGLNASLKSMCVFAHVWDIHIELRGALQVHKWNLLNVSRGKDLSI